MADPAGKLDRSARRTAAWLRDLVPQMLDLTRLPKSWDDRGGPPPTEGLVREIVEALGQAEIEDLSVPTAVPLPGGGIQLEWSGGEREVELAFYPGGQASAIALRSSDEAPLDEQEFPIEDFASIRRALSWLKVG